MKKTTAAISLILVVSLCFMLVACGPAVEDVVGTWSGTWEYNGKLIACAIVLNSDGSYAKATLRDDAEPSSESGTYEIKGGEVRLHPNGDMGQTTAYKYKNGTLVNNGHALYKK